MESSRPESPHSFCYFAPMCQINHGSIDLFQQVVVDMSANWVTLEVEVDVHVFAESTRVIVSVCLGVTKRF